MAESSDSRDRPAVAIDAIPHPIVGYRLEDGVPTIRIRNDALETAFDAGPPGTTVRSFIDRATAADAATAAEVASNLADGNTVDVSVRIQQDGPEAPAQRYRLQRLDSLVSPDADGFLLVTPQAATESVGLAPDRIASVISHDLRNPLDVANAHLRAARRTGAEDHFDEVERSHDRMEQIIQDVLTLARGTRAVDVAATVDVGSVAAEAWSTVETDDATLTVRDDLPTLRADPDHLQRLFENLYRNSVEHAPTTDGSTGGEANGGDGIQVTVGSVDGGFFVADDGRGIPPGEREQVFEVGYSGDESASGTGLGLTIVAQIAEAHDWDWSLTGSSGGGARFEFHAETHAY